jgi:hypothetical protein
MKGLMPNKNEKYSIDVSSSPNGKINWYAHVEIFEGSNGRIVRRISCIKNLTYIRDNSGLEYWQKELEKTKEQIENGYLVPV